MYLCCGSDSRKRIRIRRIRISSSTVIRIPNRIRLLVYTDKASTHDLQQFFSQLGGTVSEILTDLSAVAVHLFQLQHAVLTFLHTFLNSITKNFGRKESRIVAFKDSVLQLNVILRIEWRKKRQWIQSVISLYIFGGNFNYTPSKYKHEFIQIFLFQWSSHSLTSPFQLKVPLSYQRF